MTETTLQSEELQIERKTFDLELRQNDRGQFVRITETSGGRRNTIIIPDSGLHRFQHAIDRLASALKVACVLLVASLLLSGCYCSDRDDIVPHGPNPRPHGSHAQ